MKKQTYALKEHSHNYVREWVFIAVVLLLMLFMALLRFEINKLQAHHTQDVEVDTCWDCPSLNKIGVYNFSLGFLTSPSGEVIECKKQKCSGVRG